MTPAVLEMLFGPEADDGFRTYRTCPECGHDAADHFVGQLAVACTSRDRMPVEPGNVLGRHCHCRRAIGDPVAMAAANGHHVAPDPVPEQASSAGAEGAERWSCACGANVLRYRGGVFGLALDLPCLNDRAGTS